MRKVVSILTILPFAGVAAWSQGKISGTVRDQNGDAVPYATINVQGTKISVSADVNANFTIPAKSGDVLKVTAVGIEPTTVTVGSDPVINITVTRTTGTVNEVV